MATNAFQIHEAFASLMGLSDRILWDMYTPDQLTVFQEKLNDIIGWGCSKNNELTAAKNKVRNILFDRAKSQTKYTNKNLLASFILVTVASGTKHQDAVTATEFSLHLIVRTRKCISDDSSKNCCMNFIDEDGVVYKNWKHFIESNTLPKGIALAPSNGYYTFENGRLNIDSWLTPRNGWWQLFGMFSKINNPFNPFHNLINGMNISSVLLSGMDKGNLIFDLINMYLSPFVKPSREAAIRAAKSMLVFSHSIYNFHLTTSVLNGHSDLTVISRSQRAVAKKNFEETYETDVIRLLNEIPDQEFLNKYYYLSGTVIVVDTDGCMFRKCKSSHPGLSEIKVPVSDKVEFNPASNHPLTKHAFSKSSELTEYLTTKLDHNYLPIVSEECLQDCVQYLINYQGENIAELLVEKTTEFIKNFKGVIERSTKIKLSTEVVLWDLYKLCEKSTMSLLKSAEKLENEMPTFFEELFFHYEKMSCSSNAVPRLKCSECSGFYQEFS